MKVPPEHPGLTSGIATMHGGMAHERASGAHLWTLLPLAARQPKNSNLPLGDREIILEALRGISFGGSVLACWPADSIDSAESLQGLEARTQTPQ